MTKAELQGIVNTYMATGILKAKELLLPLPSALQFLDDLGAMGITVMGVDGWTYIDRDPNKIVQDLAIDYYVGDAVMESSESSALSIKQVREYLLSLPSEVPLVSFTLDIPQNWVDEVFRPIQVR